MKERPTVRQTLAGVRDAVLVYGSLPFTKVKVKELSKEQILRLAREWEFIPINATPFYYSKGNYERLWELHEEGKLVLRDCAGTAFELPEAQAERREQLEQEKEEHEKRARELRKLGMWEVRSKSNPSMIYTVKRKKYNGREILSCNCPCWVYNTRKDRTCPHTDEVNRILGGLGEVK